MKTLAILLFPTTLIAMEETLPHFCQTRSRSASLTLAIESSRYPDLYPIIHTAFNGHTDKHIVETVGKELVKNRPPIVYNELFKLRESIRDRTIEDEETVVNYVLKELVDTTARKKRDKRKERQQKYLIACCGACSNLATGAVTTLISSAATALLTYYLSQ